MTSISTRQENYPEAWMLEKLEATRPSGNHTILLIDDCVAERDLYELTLRPTFNVLTASRGLDGLSVAVAERPDVIVLDVMMPGLDGWETCTRIKSHPRTAEIPVILLTGAADLDLSLHAVAVGASAILRKPCPIDHLREQIEAVIRE